jgi:hypothetical protein
MISRIAAFIITALFSLQPKAQVQIDCKFMNRVQSEIDIRICSSQQLSNQELLYIIHTVERTPSAYAEFRGNVRPFIPLIVNIAIVDMGDVAFSESVDNNVMGLYYPGDNRLYITRESLKEEGNVVAHELVHLINYHLGISDVNLDERLAYEFEVFFNTR